MTAPVITAVTSPVAVGNQIIVVGTGFGRVAMVGLVDNDTSEYVFTQDFTIDSGVSIHVTVPRTTPSGFYYVLLSTSDGEHSVNQAGLVNVLLAPIPAPPLPDLNPQGTTITRIRDRLRIEIADYIQGFSIAQPGDGMATRFDLPAESVLPGTLQVLVQIDGETTAVPLVPDADYTLETRTGIITTIVPVALGSKLFVRGQYAQFFLDEELDRFIESAFWKHAHGTTDRTIYRDPLTGRMTYTTAVQEFTNLPLVEEHPVALLAAIEALWALAADASYDIDVTTAEGTNLPRQERYRAIMEMIKAQQERYNTLSQQLNVGLSRIEMFTLRRVSRTTGRYVPIYTDREYDDQSAPIRVYPPVDSGITGTGSAQRVYVGQQYPPGV
jgi:hypothetical protein